jgi:hypothetical protein
VALATAPFPAGLTNSVTAKKFRTIRPFGPHRSDSGEEAAFMSKRRKTTTTVTVTETVACGHKECTRGVERDRETGKFPELCLDHATERFQEEFYFTGSQCQGPPHDDECAPYAGE